MRWAKIVPDKYAVQLVALRCLVPSPNPDYSLGRGRCGCMLKTALVEPSLSADAVLLQNRCAACCGCRLRISGVPFFLIGAELDPGVGAGPSFAMSGAQPAEAFLEAFDEALAKASK